MGMSLTRKRATRQIVSPRKIPLAAKSLSGCKPGKPPRRKEPFALRKRPLIDQKRKFETEGERYAIRPKPRKQPLPKRRRL
jgi:hypothetical protein